MSSDVAISARGVSKTYVIRHRDEHPPTLAEVALARLRHPLRRDAVERFVALDDVSFDVHAGEVLGIIGRNGAGKSTLLKVLSRITAPTSGEVLLYGRIGSLLEVGTGFHPELTGRENIYLNGSILGMRRREIDRQFDAIVEFSGVARFLDTPVKRYSSGMYVRLAFAVAAHLDTEILLVDEVLAVGDADFQRRSVGKMSDAARSGRTILFVSHNLALQRQMSERALWLVDGRVEAIGDVDDITRRYGEAGGLQASTGRHSFAGAERWNPHQLDGRVTLDSGELVGGHDGFVGADDDVVVDLRLVGRDDVDDFRLQATLLAGDRTPVGATLSPAVLSIAAGETLDVRFTLPSPRPTPGRYSLELSVGRGGDVGPMEQFDVVLDVLPFEVLPVEHDGAAAPRWPASWGRVRFVPLEVEVLARDAG